MVDKGTVEAAAGNLKFRNQAFIGGRFVDSLSGRTFPAENPATGEAIASVAECGAEDVDAAVRSAREAFDNGPWGRMAPGERKKVLLRLAGLIEKHRLELALLDALEAGKPISDCVGIDLAETIECLSWHAEAADKLCDEVAPSGPDSLALVVREPLGVIGAIIPWNYPLLMAAWKVAPALATGNSVVLKPAKLSSLSALRLAELGAEAGLPDGVLNVVPGPGDKVGEALGRHLEVDGITFTGSTEIGRRFLQYSAESNLKRVALECGGKSPQIVMGDVRDLDAIAEDTFDAVFWNMGENCCARSRLIVHRAIKDALLEKLAEKSKGWLVGNPLYPETRIGALIEEPHLQKVLAYIEEGRASGAKLFIGGHRVLVETGGYFVEPTIFDEVTCDMRIAREEIFGPVLAVISFEDENEAIAIANDTHYGLGASIYTEDLNTAHRLARAVRAGVVSVNCYSEGNMATPFGGFKQSGFGGRDKGAHAHAQYTELKTIWLNLA
jgi:gamma-glutamyl-gamma-aminobutyraldehyde dehydrogenase